jgi:curved DNA-binding protein CbpA
MINNVILIENETEDKPSFYDVLGVSKDAKADDIK